MKINKLTTGILLSSIFSSGVVLAADWDADLHGYIKSGLLMNSEGNRVQSVGLFTNYGKFRLGNEQNTKIELVPTIKATNDDGAWAKVRANLTHETNCTSDWNCVDGDGHDIQFREGMVEIGGLDFAPGVVFWAGKRYNSYNTSNHQYDWEYIQYNGTGGGVDNVDIGIGKLDVGVYAFTPSDRASVAPSDPKAEGYPEDLSLNLILKQIAGTGLAFQLAAHTMEESSWSPNAATSGLGVGAQYNFDGFYGMTNGYSKITVQYGKGMAAGDSLGKNGWGFGNSDDTQSGRIVFDALANVNETWDISTFAFYQMDSDYNPWSDWSDPTNSGYDRNLWAVGVRPYQQIAKYFAMQYEVGYEYIDEDRTGGAKGGLVKATIAPTITFEEGFWGRPQIRTFVTYANWDDDAMSRLDSGYTRDGATDTWNFGVQAEVWF